MGKGEGKGKMGGDCPPPFRNPKYATEVRWLQNKDEVAGIGLILLVCVVHFLL